MYKVKQVGSSWMLVKVSLFEGGEFEMKSFDDYEKAIAECEKLNGDLVKRRRK